MAIQLEPPAADAAEHRTIPAVRAAVPATTGPVPAPSDPPPAPAAPAAAAPVTAAPVTAAPVTAAPRSPGPVIGGVPVLEPPLPGSQRPFPIRRLDPVTASDRMLVLCCWATALGLIGLAAAFRGLLAVRAGTAPGWYESTLAGLGSAAIGLAAGAFPVVRRSRLPWLLLCLASVTLLTGVGLTVGAL